MEKMTFDSWQEAYLYQLTSRTDKSDPLFMFDLRLRSGFDAIDNLVATTGEEIVWVAVLEGACEQYKQYGVSSNLNWYSIEFDGYKKEIEYKKGSLRVYSSLPAMVEFEPDSIVVVEHLSELYNVYRFLKNGKILPFDDVNEEQEEDALALLEYADEYLLIKSLEEDYYDFFNDEAYCECEECLSEEEEEIFPTECDIEEFEEFDELFEAELDECFAVEEDCSPPKELKNMYRISYGFSGEGENSDYLELTVFEADEKFEELVKNGYDFVELSQLKRLHNYF
jgi:hypothetical protein